MNKILVTGGAGFIGSHLVDKLIEKNYKVIVIDNLSTGKRENLNSQANFYKIDILDSKISQIFQKEKPEAVFHYAAQIDVRKSVEDPIENAKVNILGSLNLLENCKNFRIKKFIFASSGGAIYGTSELLPTPESYLPRPESPYGLSKLVIEEYLKIYKNIYGLDFVSLRYANIYGPRQNSKGEAGVVAIFIDKLLEDKRPIIFGTGEQTRDYLYVEDAIEAALKALNYRGLLPIFNVGTGLETNVNEIYNLISQKLGKNIKPIYAPAKPGDLKRSCLDISKIKKDIGWKPKYDLEKGLEKTIQWFLKN